jgi:hypothetical protein
MHVKEEHRADPPDAFVKAKMGFPWLFRAMDRKSVIGHLWWEDYVASRRAMLPIE